MRSETIDWSVIRNALIGLVVSIIISSGLVVGSIYFKSVMQQEFNRNNAEFQNISRRYLAVDEEERLIIEYFPSFRELHQQGIIGEEHRLDWLEVLRDLGSSLKLSGLSYTIESQKPYAPSFAVNLSSYGLFRSTMRLNMQLLHEGDLFNLLEALNRQALGSFTVSSCRLNNNVVDDSSSDANRSNVTAECSLDWLTLRLASGLDIEV